jgi:AcrR family transcriptional regulator
MQTRRQQTTPKPKPLPRGRNRLAPEDVLARQRERLLAAMRSAIAHEGFQAASVSSVASQAHVARPVFYRAFPGGKEECFLTVYDQTIEDLVAITATAYEQAPGGLPAIEAALRALTMAMAKDPDLARLCLIDIAALGARGLEHRDALFTRAADVLTSTLADPHSDQAVSPRKVRALVGGCYQLLYMTVAEERTAELPTLVPDMLYMLLAYRLGPQSTSQSQAAASV